MKPFVRTVDSTLIPGRSAYRPDSAINNPHGIASTNDWRFTIENHGWLRLLSQTGIHVCHATDLWRTEISNFGTLAYFCFKFVAWRTLGTKTSVIWRTENQH